MKHNRFVNYGSGSVFTCRVCKRRTRHTTAAIGSELCGECYEIRSDARWSECAIASR